MTSRAGRRSEVFISATSKDLGSVRKEVTDGLWKIGCHPVVQDTFPPDYREIARMLQDKIAACDAVVHMVGMRYGEEPPLTTLPEGAPRRSYTQMEADLASELGKKLYVFVCPEDFPYDAAHAEEPEDKEKKALQQAYRQGIMNGNPKLFTPVKNCNELAERIRELPIEREALREEHAQTLETIHEIKAATEAFSTDPELLAVQLKKAIKKSAQEKMERLKQEGAGRRAVEEVERERDLQMEEVDRMVRRIVEGVHNAHQIYVKAVEILQEEGVNALLDFLKEKELADLIEKQKARRQREVEELRQLLGVRLLQASNLEASLRYDEAITVYREVLNADPDWFDPYPDFTWLLMNRGEVINPVQGNPMLEEAERLCRNALARMGTEKTPLWASIQNRLAIVLQVQDERLSGKEVGQKLEEAIAACRAALEVRTREAMPQDWAATQNNLANALQRQGERLSDEERDQKLEEAATAYRAALEVYTREESLQQWATTQNNLASVLQRQGERLSDEKRAQKKLEAAVAACCAALEVRTREALPQDWAMTQNNLANALQTQGTRLFGKKGDQKLEEAVVAYRAALEVRSRKALPQDWAMTQNNLAVTLRVQGERLSGKEGAQKLEEAVAACLAALEIYTREALPQRWATTQNNLASTYLSLGSIFADMLKYEEALKAGQEAIQCHRALAEASADKEVWNTVQASELGCISFCQLLLKQNTDALAAAEEGLRLDASQTWIQVNRAHALLFLGRFDEAKSLYLQYAKEDLGNGKTFAQAVLNNFDEFEKAGITHPDMAKILKLLEKQ